MAKLNEFIKHCNKCKKNTIHTYEGINHILHAIITIISIGFWIVVWFFLHWGANIRKETKNICKTCGISSIDAKKR